MSNSSPISEYLMLFRGPDWDQGRSPEEVDRLLGHVMAWFDAMSAQGKVKAGQPLARTGTMVSGNKGARAVADGPFAESKETIGGYLLVTAASFEEAVLLAKACPTLDHGITIEVRPVLDECPCFKRASQRLANAVAA
jgi:hypothetical protein